jgi:hypothetical protein
MALVLELELESQSAWELASGLELDSDLALQLEWDSALQPESALALQPDLELAWQPDSASALAWQLPRDLGSVSVARLACTS